MCPAANQCGIGNIPQPRFGQPTVAQVNNVRFPVRGVAQRPNPASKALARCVKALATHWREHFGYEPLLCEPTAGR